MREGLIQYSSRPTDRVNVYDLNCYKGPYNVVQYGKHSFIRVDDVNYKAHITHYQIEGISDLVLSLTLPEIKGHGKVSFNKYFGFGLIKKFSITLGKNLLISMSGAELLQKYLTKCKDYEKTVYEKLMFNDKMWLRYRYGKGMDNIIYEKTTINIPLKFYFDESIPYSILRIPKDNGITFNLELNKIKNVINYNKEFKDKSLDNISEIINPVLTLREYNTINDNMTDKYYTQYEEICFDSKENLSTPRFKGITDLIYYTKSDIFNNGKAFISYPDYDYDEISFIETYEKTLLKDIIIIAEDLNSPEFKRREFDMEKCEFEEVKNNIIKFNIVNECIIEILGIPVNKKIWYHKNILTFNRRHDDKVYNISEKFRYIKGIYYPFTNLIDFTYVKSTIDISDVSIPNELWSHEFNTSLGDLRSKFSKDKLDIYVNNPFVEGLDFVGKESGILDVTIDAGKTSLSDVNLPVINPELSVPYTSNYSPRKSIDFNNNLMIIEPARMISEPNANFSECKLHIHSVKYNENDIKSLINYKIHIGIHHCRLLKYDKNNVIQVKEL